MPSQFLAEAYVVVLAGDLSTGTGTPDGSDVTAWYPTALTEVLAGNVVLQTGPFRLYPMACEYDPTHEFRSDLPTDADVGTPSEQFVLNPGDAEFEVEFTMLRHYPSPSLLTTSDMTATLRAGIVVLDTGSAATDLLIAYLGRRLDSRLIDSRATDAVWLFDDGMVAI